MHDPVSDTAQIRIPRSRLRQTANQRLGIVALAGALVAVLASGLCGWSWYQRHKVEASYRQALANESESLAAKAEQLLASGDRMEAIQVALAALPESSAAKDRPLVPSAQLALEHALQVYPSSSLWRPCYSVKEAKQNHAFSPDGLQAVESMDGSVTLRSIEDGSKAVPVDARTQISEATHADVGALRLQFVGSRLLCYADGGLALFDTSDGSICWRASVDGLAVSSDIAASPDGEHLAIGCSFGPAHVIGDDRSDELIVRVVSTKDGSVAQGFKLPLDEYAEHTDEVRIAYSPDGGTLAIANSGRLWLITLANDEVIWTDLPASQTDQLVFCGSSVVVVSPTSELTDYGSEPLPTVEVACYASEPSLSQQWSQSFDASSAVEAGLERAHVAGTYALGDGRMQIVLSTGRTVQLIDELTGDQTYQLTTTAPIVTSQINNQLLVADQEGTVYAYALSETEDDEEEVEDSPDEADEGLAPQDMLPHISCTELARLSVAEGSSITFGGADETTYLAAYDAAASVHRIYRLVGRSDAPSRTPYKSKYLHMHLEAVGAGTPNQLLVSGNETEVAGLDANTIKRQWKRSFGKLGLAESRCDFACGAQNIYVFEAEHATDKAPVICVISPIDGKTVDRIELSEDWDSIESVREQTCGDSTRLIIQGHGTAAVIDTASHKELARVTAASGQILGAWLGTDALLVLEAPTFGGTNNSFELFSLSDGTSQAGQILSCEVKAGGTERLVGMDSAGTTIAVSCADGYIRAFDTTDWSLIWQGNEELSWLSTLAFAPDGTSLFAQDGSGTCLLLSAEDGHVVTASSATLPIIDELWADPSHPEVVTAVYRLSDADEDVGISSISLVPESFGPLSDIFTGVYYTPDGQLALAWDPTDDPQYSTYHHYTLDELLELAHDAIKGHELTDAERRLYRIN